MNKLSSHAALHEQDLMTMFDAVNTSLQNRALTSAGLAIGTSSTSAVKVVNTVTYLSGGVFKSKSSAEVAFTATTHDIPANGTKAQEAKYLVCVDGSGTLSLTMGAIADSGASVLPEIPTGLTPIGYVKVSVAAGSTPFDASTDALSAAHLTVTYVNLGYLAPRFDSVQ